MSFRERMSKQRAKAKSRPRPAKQSGRYPTFFLKDKVPQGIEFFASKEGEHIIDIIPFKAGPNMPLLDDDSPVTKEGELDYLLDLEVHMNVGSMKKPFVCPYENFGLPCPICEYMKARRLEKEEWSQIKTKRRVVYLVWVHDTIEQEKKGLQIFHASHFLMEEKLSEIAKIPKGGGSIDFSDYEDEGMSIAWTHKGTGRDTRYVGHKLIERDRKIPDKILDQSFSLDSIVMMHPSYEEIKVEFLGNTDEEEEIENEEDDGYEEEETKPVKVKKKKRTIGKVKKRKKPIEEDDEYEDDGEDLPF